MVSGGIVKTHVKRILAKLELRDRTQAAVWVYEHGVVELAAAAARVEEYPTSSALQPQALDITSQ